MSRKGALETCGPPADSALLEHQQDAALASCEARTHKMTSDETVANQALVSFSRRRWRHSARSPPHILMIPTRCDLAQVEQGVAQEAQPEGLSSTVLHLYAEPVR